MHKKLFFAARVRRVFRSFFASITVYSILLLLLNSFPVSHAQQATQKPRSSTPTRIENEKRTDAAREDAVALSQALLDLQNPWTVMCVAAHPDDEDGATLTQLRHKYGVHTVSLFSTYGEGGQNAVGPELYEELGAIRARETMEAAEVQGSEPHFLALRDFGFSKSADEAFGVWNHDEALRRMVYQIRLLRPDVIITNHDTVSGHGHHQATGRLVLEAFDVAADPVRFPEQLRGNNALSVWQAQRLFVRDGFGDAANAKTADDAAHPIVSFDVNEQDYVRGSTYAEQALEALHRHATQGPWPQKLPAGARIVRYRLVRSLPNAAPLSAAAHTVLDGLQLPETIASKLAPPKLNNRPLTDFINERTRLFYALAGAQISHQYVVPETDKEAPRFHLMAERLNRALAAASGITATLTPRDKVVIPNSTATFSFDISNKGSMNARVQSAGLPEFIQGRGKKSISAGLMQALTPYTLLPDTTFNLAPRYNIPGGARLSVPHAAHLYDERVFGEPFSATAVIDINGVSFPLTATTRVDVAPAVEIESIKPSLLVLTPETLLKPSTFVVTITNHQRTPFKGHITVGLEAEIDSSRKFGKEFTLAPNETRQITDDLRAALHYEVTGADTLRSTGGSASFSIYLPKSSIRITDCSVDFIESNAHVAPNLRVGYVRSFDETLRNALAALGVEAKELTIEDVRSSDLSGYDTIIIDNRGYEAHHELVAYNARLLDYARAGGNLIVFYHKTNEWNPDPRVNRPQLAPYPIILGGERVTYETAPVTFTEPASALLNFPNKITVEDFKDWIQERGLYYPQQWDTAHYSAPFAMNDPGEQPLRGGLLATDYGRGRYIYTSMVWYRQLRAGVPGAYRMFANMISYGRAGNGTQQIKAMQK